MTHAVFLEAGGQMEGEKTFQLEVDDTYIIFWLD